MWDLIESMREEARPAERMLLIRVIWDRAAVAGPTVRDASSSMIVSICKYSTISATWAMAGSATRTADQQQKQQQDEQD